MLFLRRLENKDVVVVQKWLEKESVAKWFGDASEWLYEIEHRNDEFAFIKHFIVEGNDVPIGFCQYYDWNKAFEKDGYCEPAGTYGIDYMIGDEHLLGKGFGKELVTLICDKVIEEHPDAILIIADPSIEEQRVNVASIKALEANGFRYDNETAIYKKRLIV
jgi:RimJ/RimL family protein N-acetyltransferase